MRFAALALIGFAALTASANTAAARDGCGRGYYWNGYACVVAPYQPPVQQYYPAPQPYYQQPYGYGGNVYRAPRAEAYPIGPRGTCPRGYTIQHGRCEPYRGR